MDQVATDEVTAEDRAAVQAALAALVAASRAAGTEGWVETKLLKEQLQGTSCYAHLWPPGKGSHAIVQAVVEALGYTFCTKEKKHPARFPPKYTKDGKIDSKWRSCIIPGQVTAANATGTVPAADGAANDMQAGADDAAPSGGPNGANGAGAADGAGGPGAQVDAAMSADGTVPATNGAAIGPQVTIRARAALLSTLLFWGHLYTTSLTYPNPPHRRTHAPDAPMPSPPGCILASLLAIRRSGIGFGVLGRLRVDHLNKHAAHCAVGRLRLCGRLASHSLSATEGAVPRFCDRRA